jgi:glutamine amidotransferase-like uncharacterized protein
MPKCCIEFDTSDQASYIPQIEKLMGEMGIETVRVNCHDIMHGALLGADMVTFPGGLGAGEGLRQYGFNFAKAMQFFVASGGGYLGVCGGAYSAGVNVPWLMALIARYSLRLIDTNAQAPSLINFIADYLSLQDQRLLVECDVSQLAHPITIGHGGERLNLVYSGGPILTALGSSVTPLVYYYNGDLPEAHGQVAVAAAQFGRGHVVISGPHPEASTVAGSGTGEPCCRWLYEAMVQYCLQPADSIYFPAEITPWEEVKPFFSPALPMAALGAFVVGAVVATNVGRKHPKL